MSVEGSWRSGARPQRPRRGPGGSEEVPEAKRGDSGGPRRLRGGPGGSEGAPGPSKLAYGFAKSLEPRPAKANLPQVA